MSSNYASLYNKLPTLIDAHNRFTDRDAIFAKLSPVLAKYGQNFGVCLVHAHCEVAEGEIMISDGNISQPQRRVTKCYAERWLASGEPYEYTRTPTQSPPKELLKQFREAVGGLSDILGLFYIAGDNGKSEGKIAWERTDGRKNYVEIVDGGQIFNNAITTAWCWVNGIGLKPAGICQNAIVEKNGGDSSGGISLGRSGAGSSRAMHGDEILNTDTGYGGPHQSPHLGVKTLILKIPAEVSYTDYNNLLFLNFLRQFVPRPIWKLIMWELCERFLWPLRDPTFDKWADQGFGVCLVHIDYRLEKDEIVMGRGDVFEPAYKGRDHYPVRWLLDGRAYEFTDSPWAASLPQELLTAVNAVIPFMMLPMFGICYLPQQVRTGAQIAVVDAVPSKKQSIVSYIERDKIPDRSKAVRTAWRIGSKDRDDRDYGACYVCNADD
ncbi:hypothetical protein BDQ12DRAFT_657919 [Crucibulum laeve]|uniref:Uncharacterized protein n=1 Tax=Crucibulum laeve TaxID=68775 RepID=A0A5C3LMD1_9AGAR|nr:hypothetical protein BDQ12DRAFT_657919 [Crucibulum laeve]